MLLLLPAAANVTKSYCEPGEGNAPLFTPAKGAIVAQGMMPLTRAAPAEVLLIALTRTLLKTVFRFWPAPACCVVVGLRNGTNVTVLPAFRFSEPMVTSVVAPVPAP